MNIIKVEVQDISLDQSLQDIELVFHLDDGNKYHVNAVCFDYMTQEDREALTKQNEQSEKWSDFEEKENYREAYWKRNNFKGFKRRANPY